jgi:hypothetical protein
MKYAARAGIEVVRTWELPVPAATQIKIEYEKEDGKI